MLEATRFTLLTLLSLFTLFTLLTIFLLLTLLIKLSLFLLFKPLYTAQPVACMPIHCNVRTLLEQADELLSKQIECKTDGWSGYESFATVGEIRVYWRADFKSGSRVLKKVF